MKGLVQLIAVVFIALSTASALAGTKQEVMKLGFRENTTPLRLSSGEVVEVEGMAKIYVTGSKNWILILNYRTDTLDLETLRKRAELIWPRFKPYVEKLKLKHAGIHAKKYPVKNPTKDTNFTGYNILLEFNAVSGWRFMEHKR